MKYKAVFALLIISLLINPEEVVSQDYHFNFDNLHLSFIPFDSDSQNSRNMLESPERFWVTMSLPIIFIIGVTWLTLDYQADPDKYVREG
jgi:hypothetical protein